LMRVGLFHPRLASPVFAEQVDPIDDLPIGEF